MEYRIVSKETDEESGELLYWSNDFGWVPVEQSDIFYEAEVNYLRLPIGGTWERIVAQ